MVFVLQINTNIFEMQPDLSLQMAGGDQPITALKNLWV